MFRKNIWSSNLKKKVLVIGDNDMSTGKNINQSWNLRFNNQRMQNNTKKHPLFIYLCIYRLICYSWWIFNIKLRQKHEMILQVAEQN